MAFEPISIVVELADKVTEPARKVGESFSELGGEAGGLGEVMGGPVAEGLKIGVAAIAAVGVAVVGATAAFAAFALEQAEAREKQIATIGAFVGGTEAATALVGKLDDLRESLGMTRAELVPMAEQLLAMGVRAGDLEPQLTALASIKAIGSEGGQEAYLSILKKTDAGVKITTKSLAELSKTGVDVNEIAKKMHLSTKQLEAQLKAGGASSKAFAAALREAVTEKGADALATQAKSLGAQWAKFKEDIGHLFEGVDASPFLDALKEVFGLFDSGTNTGKTLKATITGAFNAIFAAAAKALPYVKIGIEKIIIAALKFYIAIKSNWTVISFVLKGLAIGIGVVVAAIGVMVGILVVVTAATFAFLGAIVAAVGAVIMFAVKAGQALAGWASGAVTAAEDFIKGLVEGITAGVGKVVDAAKNLGHEVLGGIKNVLGVHSPSVEFMKIGVQAGAGFSQGLESSATGAAASGQQMASTAGQAVKRPAPAMAGGGGGVNVTFSPGSIVIDGAGKGAEELTDTMISKAFERICLQMGLGGA
jgi:hypothetical protein